jgi:hypothetical protein
MRFDYTGIHIARETEIVGVDDQTAALPHQTPRGIKRARA